MTKAKLAIALTTKLNPCNFTYPIGSMTGGGKP